jgi:hypothetical protein
LHGCYFSSFVSGQPDVLKKRWLDEGGAVMSTELFLVLVIAAICIVVGLVILHDAADRPFGDRTGATAATDPDYEQTGVTATSVGTSPGGNGSNTGDSDSAARPSGSTRTVADQPGNRGVGVNDSYTAGDVLGAIVTDNDKGALAAGKSGP